MVLKIKVPPRTEFKWKAGNTIFPDKYNGSHEMEEFRRWMIRNKYTLQANDKLYQLVRRFIYFACATENICRDYCLPYVMDLETAQCTGCLLSEKEKTQLCAHKKIRDINWRDLENFKAFLIMSRKKATRKDRADPDYLPQERSGRTINSAIGSVITWFKMKADSTKAQVWRNRYAQANTVTRVKVQDSKLFRAYSLKTLGQIIELAKADSYENYTIIMLLFYTGGRAQFYGLRVKDVKYGERNGDTSEGMDIVTMGTIAVKVKGGKWHTIPLHPKLQKIIKEHLRTRDYESPMLFRYGRIPTITADYKNNQAVLAHLFKKYQGAIGTDESFHTHRMRKSAATHGKRFGMDLQFMQAILGHASIDTTADIYTEVDIQDVGREWAKIDIEERIANAAKAGKAGNMDLDKIFAALDTIAPQMPPEYRPGIEGMITGLKSLIKAAMEGSS